MIGLNFSDDKGRLYENLVFVNLRRRNKKIFYWKNNNECDFIVRSGKKLELIQVYYNFNQSKNRQRKIKGLTKAMKKINIHEGTIITENYDSIHKTDHRKIKFILLWKWLLKK